MLLVLEVINGVPPCPRETGHIWDLDVVYK
jgi:hypothetical protein